MSPSASTRHQLPVTLSRRSREARRRTATAAPPQSSILSLIEEAEKYILKNIRIGMKLQGLTRVDVPEIDPEAFREAIINAFCHRDYRDPDEVRIAIFPDRVEVRNPGRLMEGVTLRTLKTAKVSRRRNPLIADLLRRIHLIEAWKSGSVCIFFHFY